MTTYFTGQTTTADSESLPPPSNPAWQAFLTGTSGALSATVEIWASQDDDHWDLVGTINLSVAAWTTTADDDQAKFIPDKFGTWKHTKATLSAISGTGAAVTVIGG
jgi:hypothetical protein